MIAKGETSKLIYLLAALVGCPLFLSGCGGGGSGGTASDSSSQLTASLKVAESVSVVDSQGSGGSGIKALTVGYRAISPVSLSSDSDYHTDEASVFVEERSAEAFEIINEILCSIGQSKYDEMMNEGVYKAQIDINQCAQGRDSASQAGSDSKNQSSGSSMPDYEMWTVESSRASSSAPQIVKVWIEQEGGDHDPPSMIFVKMTITEGKSDSNPVGVFDLYFKGHPLDSNGDPDTSVTIFKGYLKALQSGILRFIIDGGFASGNEFEFFTEKVAVDKGVGKGSMDIFKAYSSDKGSGSEVSRYNIAYNDTHFFRKNPYKPGDEVCLDRSDFDTSAWRYGLYDSNGARVTTNSGFPIKTGTGEHGWVGYWGLWMPDGVSINNGDTVYTETYGPDGGTSTPYTVFASGGKLKRHTKKSIQLADMNGIPLSWHECDKSGSGICNDVRVEWSKGDQFYKNAFRNQSTNWTWQDITSQAILSNISSNWDFNFWAESLGGSGRINLKDPLTGNFKAPTDSTDVIFHVEDIVYPGDSDIPANLACFDNCPDPDNIYGSNPFFARSAWDNMSTNFSNIDQFVSYTSLVADTHYVDYDFDSTTMQLEYGGSFAVMTSATQEYQWGIWTGAMVEPVMSNFSAMACDWDANGTCPWQVWDKLDTFYTWESGPDQWNKLTVLEDITFDPPLSVEYLHGFSNYSAKYYLDYNGFGDLHGIPGKCVDMDTGLDSDCWDSSGTKYIRWVPEFTIPDGSTLTDAVSSAEYIVKALEKEQRMKSVAVSNCSSLNPIDYTLPGMNEWIEPDIGTKPSIDNAPAVIGGVLQ